MCLQLTSYRTLGAEADNFSSLLKALTLKYLDIRMNLIESITVMRFSIRMCLAQGMPLQKKICKCRFLILFCSMSKLELGS